MSFLFPISIMPGHSICSERYEPYIIQTKRLVNRYRHLRIVVDKIREVNRVHPDIENLSEEYFVILKEHIPSFVFYCDILSKSVSLDFCLTSCRWKNKTNCILYRGTRWGCLDCPYGYRHETCNRITDCKHRLYVADWVSLYFAELLRLSHIIRRMRYGRGVKKNSRGKGPQLYYSVGILFKSGKRRRRMSLAQKLGIFRYKKRIRKKKKLLKASLS